MHDDSQRPIANPVFQSDEDSNSMPQGRFYFYQLLVAAYN